LHSTHTAEGRKDEKSFEDYFQSRLIILTLAVRLNS